VDLRELKLNTNTARHPWEIARFKVVNQLIKNHLPHINHLTNFTLLDMGCGDTWFIEEMSKHYPSAKMAGVDIAFEPNLLELLQQRFMQSNIGVYPSLESAKPHLQKKVDVVLLLDVIEHIEDDVAFLKWMQSFDFITNETVFIITVPAYQKLFCSHDVFLGHYRRYTNNMLVRHMEASGLEEITKGYFFLSLLPLRLMQVIKEKIFKANHNEEAKGLANWNGAEGNNSLVAKVLLADYKISKLFQKIGVKLPGLSNYILCKKFV